MAGLKDEIIGTIGNQFLGAILGAVKGIATTKAGETYAAILYKLIAAAGDPAKVKGMSAQERAGAIRAAGAAIKARLGQAIDEFTEAQAQRELTREGTDPNAALAVREREEKEMKAVFADPLGLKGA